MFTFQSFENANAREPWNKGKLVGQRRPLKPKEIDQEQPRLIESAFGNRMRSIPKRANGKASGARSAHSSATC